MSDPQTLLSLDTIWATHEKLADSDSVIIPYKAVNIKLMALYGVINGSLSSDYSCARYRLRVKTICFS